jgi:geranylgeranyl reductase
VEIAVVGGGPAGARAAELLADAGAEVVLLDPKAPWEKPCGGGLTESVFQDTPELRELRPSMQETRTVRIETDPSSGFTVPLATPIRIISRRELARWQLERARRAGASRVAARVRSLRRGGDGWTLETDQGTLRAHRLVGADGAASLVRRTVAPRFHVELAPTRVAYVPGAGPTPERMILQIFPLVAGYVWDFPRPDHRSVGIGISAGTWRRPRMDEAVEALRHSTEARPCDPVDVERRGAVIGTAQLGHGDWSVLGDDDVALLGDAAGLADPATGEGIRNALRSAQILAAAWADDGSFRSFPRRAREAFGREFDVSRVMRRILFESDTGARILEGAQRSAGAYALVATIADAVNEHDGSVPSLMARWWRARRRDRRHPGKARRGPRRPAGEGGEGPPGGPNDGDSDGLRGPRAA